MRQRWFTLAAIASAVLCLGLLASWARAQFGDKVWVRCVGHSVVVYGADGEAAAAAPGYFFDPSVSRPVFVGPSGLLRWLRGGNLGTAQTRVAGVEVYRDLSVPALIRAVVIPVAYPITLTAVLPAFWVAGLARKGRRQRLGLCPGCGYDLRATPDKCPECGAVPVAEKAA